MNEHLNARGGLREKKGEEQVPARETHVLDRERWKLNTVSKNYEAPTARVATDQKYYNFRAYKSIDRQMLCTSDFEALKLLNVLSGIPP